MESKSWYTKWRPHTIEEYSGKKLTDQIRARYRSEETRPNIVFVTGERGSGKTTICRILSKYYLCLNPKEDGTPCEECEVCRDINENLIYAEAGTSCESVTELDATISNGKDDIQEVLDDILVPPIYTKKKVIIFDECHRLTNQAQNALLKSIEQPPSYLIVFFATTNPEKMLPTVVSRCTGRLDIRRQTVADMVARLNFIAEQEHVTTSIAALTEIAKKGGRIPRECINILEEVAKTYDGNVTIDNLRRLFSDITSDKYLGFFKAANTGLVEILKFIKSLEEDDTSVTDFASGLSEFVMQAMNIRFGLSLEDNAPDFVRAVKELFDIYDVNEFDCLMQILEEMFKLLGTDAKRDASILCLAAMRISKLRLMADGLASSTQEALKENSLSMFEHGKLLEREKVERFEEKTTDEQLGESFFNNNFAGARKVTDVQKRLNPLTLSHQEETEDDETKASKLADALMAKAKASVNVGGAVEETKELENKNDYLDAILAGLTFDN